MERPAPIHTALWALWQLILALIQSAAILCLLAEAESAALTEAVAAAPMASAESAVAGSAALAEAAVAELAASV